MLYTAHMVISEPQYKESRASHILALIKGKLCLRKGQRRSAQEDNLYKKPFDAQRRIFNLLLLKKKNQKTKNHFQLILI